MAGQAWTLEGGGKDDLGAEQGLTGSGCSELGPCRFPWGVH